MGCLFVYLLSVSPTTTEALAGRDERFPMSSTRLVLHSGWSKHHIAYTSTSVASKMTVSGFSACIYQTGQGPGGTGYSHTQCDTRTQKYQTIRTQEKGDISQTQNMSIVNRGQPRSCMHRGQEVTGQSNGRALHRATTQAVTQSIQCQGSSA